MRLTITQLKWLISRGDRTVEDVMVDEYGLFVYMTNSDGMPTKVYLPKE